MERIEAITLLGFGGFACLQWSARVLPSLCLDVRGYGPELLVAVMTVRGKYSLLGDADTAAKQHGPFFLKIAQDEEHWVGVRISALQVCHSVYTMKPSPRRITVFTKTIEHTLASEIRGFIVPSPVGALMFPAP